MFDSIKLEINDNLLSNCLDLIKSHNEISYLPVSLDLDKYKASAEFKSSTKFKDSISIEIVKFCKRYVYQIKAAQILSTVISSFSYTNEDLQIQINRSSDSITQIFSALTDIKMKLQDHQSQISANLISEADNFVDHINTLLDVSSDIAEVIRIIFDCMQEYQFIAIGSKLLQSIYSTKLITEEHRTIIKDLNINLKQRLLDTNTSVLISSVKINRLQRFELVPDEGSNMSIQDIVNHLFGMSTHILDLNNDNNVKILSKILKLVAADVGIKTGIIIYVSPNIDTFFDMSNLKSLSQRLGSNGITENMVSSFDLIKRGNNPTVKSSDVITINVDDNTKMAYVFWTNDMKSFKVKSDAIHTDTIKKILRHAPSRLIETYNQLFETTITSARREDAISFNRVKHMTFNDSITEESFLQSLHDKLTRFIVQSIGKLQSSKMRDSVVDSKFSNSILEILEQCKNDIGVDARMLAAHCHIIYASSADKIVKNIKKELLRLSSIDMAQAAEIVQSVVIRPDNIYARVIASYYLHIA